jgi:HSP20 family protein
VTLAGGLKADAATATFENGMLKLTIPKAEEAKPRQIQIKANGSDDGRTSPKQVEQGS